MNDKASKSWGLILSELITETEKTFLKILKQAAEGGGMFSSILVVSRDYTTLFTFRKYNTQLYEKIIKEKAVR